MLQNLAIISPATILLGWVLLCVKSQAEEQIEKNVIR